MWWLNCLSAAMGRRGEGETQSVGGGKSAICFSLTHSLGSSPSRMTEFWSHADHPGPPGPLSLLQSVPELGHVCVGMSKTEPEEFKHPGEEKGAQWVEKQYDAFCPAWVCGAGGTLGLLGAW